MANVPNYRGRSVDSHRFAMVPRPEVPRSTFKRDSRHLTTFDAGYLIPVFVDEVLPGDTFKLRMTCFARLATPLFPTMDNMYLDSFFFFVPNRLVWTNWVKMMGEQVNPADTIDYTVPELIGPATGGFPIGSIYDYFGLPTVGQFSGTQSIADWDINALPLRAYNAIWNEWFRDQNLQDAEYYPTGNTGDTNTTYTLLRRGKRHDYFTSCLPFPQKGDAVALPLVGNPIVRSTTSTVGATLGLHQATGVDAYLWEANATTNIIQRAAGTNPGQYLYADMSSATVATVNSLRTAFATQKLLERSARGGTRYTEQILAQFGVVNPDFRLQRPEYLGGGSTPVVVNPVAQTSEPTASSPTGHLGGVGAALAQGHGFSQSFTEHGYIIGLVSVRADLTYQQGLHRMWSRKTRYDFYTPAFAHLGEQAVLVKEIFVGGSVSADNAVFGYQERWAELRYGASRVSSLFRSTAAGTLDAWHLAQKFDVQPTLGSAFIEENPPVDRVVAVPSEPHFLADIFFDLTCTRPLPTYSVPGLIDHF